MPPQLRTVSDGKNGKKRMSMRREREREREIGRDRRRESEKEREKQKKRTKESERQKGRGLNEGGENAPLKGSNGLAAAVTEEEYKKVPKLLFESRS